MKVPLLDLKLQYKQIQEQVEPKLIEVARSQMLIFGPELAKLEKDLANYCGTDYAVGVSSGTDALLAALIAIGIQSGDEVIMPSFSFFATAGTVARLGAIPIFVDSNLDDFNINTQLIEQAITPRTKAIIPVHLFGQVADMDEINRIANKHNLIVIEDCAQAIGAQYSNGKRAGSLGKMGCFSFYPTKNLGAFGEGGFITTSDPVAYDKLIKTRNHGMHPKYFHSFIGGNFRLDAIQAAVLNVKFPFLPSWHEGRRRNAKLYTKYFTNKGLSNYGETVFDSNNTVIIPIEKYSNTNNTDHHIYNQFTIRVNRRDELRQFLADNEVGAEVYYPVPFHSQECFKNNPSSSRKFPVADKLANEVISLPIFPELNEDQIVYVVDTIARFYK